MAKKKYIEVEEEEISQPEAVYYERPDELQKVLARLPQEEDCLEIYRMPAIGSRGGRPVYIGVLAPFEFTFEFVKQKWGGGRYKFEAMRKGQRDSAGIFEIEGLPIFEREESKEEEIKQQQPVFEQSVNRGDGDWRGAFLQLREELLANKQDKVFELFKEILKSREESEAAAMAKIAAMKQLFAPSQSSLDTKAILDLVKEVLTMSAGSEGGGSIWPLLLDKAGPLINQLTGALSRVSMARREELREDGIGMPIKKEQPAVNPPTGFQSLTPMLKPFVPTFILAASVNKHPADMMDLIIAQISPDRKDTVIQWLQSSDWFKDLTTLDPRVGLQQGWWQDLHHHLLSVLLTGNLPEDEGGEGEGNL